MSNSYMYDYSDEDFDRNDPADMVWHRVRECNSDLKMCRSRFKTIHQLQQVLLIFHELYGADIDSSRFQFTSDFMTDFEKEDYEYLARRDLLTEETSLRLLLKIRQIDQIDTELFNYHQELCRQIRKLKSEHGVDGLDNWGQIHDFLRENIHRVSDPAFSTLS